MDGAGSVWSSFSADPRLPASAAVRAGDADREVLRSLLREAYADGRLDRAEHDARTDTALSVRTLGECLPLLVDLVPTPPRVSSEVNIRAEALERYRRERRDARNGWIFVTSLCTGIWLLTGLGGDGLSFFWPAFPAAGVGLGYASIVLNKESRVESLEEKVTERRRMRREL